MFVDWIYRNEECKPAWHDLASDRLVWNSLEDDFAKFMRKVHKVIIGMEFDLLDADTKVAVEQVEVQVDLDDTCVFLSDSDSEAPTSET